MNELQKVEYKLLRQFLSVCEKLDLTYYLVCGSALGAVKYGGFIPWDDDIDVALPREDYETFCRDGPRLLPDWCFLQNYHTDPEFHLLGSKLRDSRTTYVEAMTERMNIHHGVFIDVFPLDGMWNNDSDYRSFRRKRAKFDAARRVRLSYNRLSPSNVLMFRTNLYWLLFKIFGYKKNTAEEIASFDKFVSSFPAAESNIWCNHANSASPKEFAAKEQYGDGATMKFEGLSVRVPAEYDAYLTQKYGDWRGDIPPGEQKGHHYFADCNLHKPYTEHILVEKGETDHGRIP